MKNTLTYRKDAAFVNREKEMKYLDIYMNIRPESILFLHGPKSSGKTTLLYRFFEQMEKEQKLDVKFLNLRETFTNVYEDFLKTFFRVEGKGDKKEKLSSDINIGFFKISSAVEKQILEKRADPFKVMKAEFAALNEKGIKPVVIIDELQTLDRIYIDNDRDRNLIIALFNFFVAMTKESHLAHIIIASSDGYFLDTVYTDSKLKKTSVFYKVDYLSKEDVMEWLLNLEKYSKIKRYTLTPEEAEKIWDTVGGSMWEIQHILDERFNKPTDEILSLYKKKMRGVIAHYAEFDEDKREILQLVDKKETVSSTDLEKLPVEIPRLRELLRDMVRNNILYFDPTEAVYYPQGRSYRWGIQLFFKSLS